MDKKTSLSAYDKALLTFIIDWTKEKMQPPSIDTMISHVGGRTSKSTVFCHLNKMVKLGYLKQNKPSGSYVPTFKDQMMVTVPLDLLIDIQRELYDQHTDRAYAFASELKTYISNK